jgi:hypothetical protein
VNLSDVCFLLVFELFVALVVGDEDLVRLFERSVETVFAPHYSLVRPNVHTVFPILLLLLMRFDLHYFLPHVFIVRVSF